MAIAYWAATAIASVDPSIGVPLLSQTRLDVVVVGFAFTIAVLASVIFGTLPAWQASAVTDVVARMREEGGSTTGDPKRQRMRSVLIVAETTLAVVLLVGAGLLARSFERLLAVDLGFNPNGVQTFAVSLPTSRYPTPLQRQAFIETLLSRAAAMPNVESAGAVFGLPLTNFRYGISTSSRDGVALSDDEQDELTLQVRLVSPDYFKTMGIPIVKGRGFSAGDRMGAQPVAMLNQAGASRVWRNQDALGHQLELGTRMGLGGARAGGTVVGIVADVHDYGRPFASRRRCTAAAQWPDGASRSRKAATAIVVAGAAAALVFTGLDPTCRVCGPLMIRLGLPRWRSRDCTSCDRILRVTAMLLSALGSTECWHMRWVSAPARLVFAWHLGPGAAKCWAW